MTVTPDLFVRFVDVLAEAMDDPEVSGPALAARVHLSRFHFDRLVAAATGEPPATLRRRVMLERAAYRLVTTDRDVLDVAIEAGYASNEAFTRAFTRAFGQPPSGWRRGHTAFRLPAPGDIHFHPPGGLRVPASRKVTAMDLLTRMVEHHVWLVGELLDRADRLTPAQLEAPIEVSVEGVDDDPTVRSLLARLVGQMAMWDAVTHDRPYDFATERTETLADLHAKLDRVGPALLEQLHAVVDEGRLDETFVNAMKEPPEVFSFGGMVSHVLTFAAGRRTLVCGALLDAGISDLGYGDPIHWVGGTEPARARV